jgi:hypothetical protein
MGPAIRFTAGCRPSSKTQVSLGRLTLVWRAIDARIFIFLFYFFYFETCIETQSIFVTSIFIGSLPAVRFFKDKLYVWRMYIEPATWSFCVVD